MGSKNGPGAIFLATAAMLATWFLQVQLQWDGMQRYYLAHYVVASAGWFNKYLVLHTVVRRGKAHPTVPAKVSPVKLASYTRGDSVPAVGGSAGARRVRLVNPVIAVDKARFQVFLRDWVYDGQTHADMAKPGMWWGLGVLVFGLCFAWPQDCKAQRVLEGPPGARRGAGHSRRVQLQTETRRRHEIPDAGAAKFRERVWIKYSHGPMILIPPEDEPKHFLLMGDTGSGKSALIRQML